MCKLIIIKSMKKKYELTIKYYTETEDYLHLESLFSKLDNFFSIYDFYVSTIKFDERILKTIIKNDLKDMFSMIINNKDKMNKLIEEMHNVEIQHLNKNKNILNKFSMLKNNNHTKEKRNLNKTGTLNNEEKQIVINEKNTDNISNNPDLLNDRIYSKLVTLKNFIWKKKSIKNIKTDNILEMNNNNDHKKVKIIKSQDCLQINFNLNTNFKKQEEMVFKFIEKVVILNIIEIADVEFNNTKFQRELFYYATNKVKEDEKMRLKLKDINLNESDNNNKDESIEISFYLLFISLLVSFALIYFQIIYTT